MFTIDQLPKSMTAVTKIDDNDTFVKAREITYNRVFLNYYTSLAHPYDVELACLIDEYESDIETASMLSAAKVTVSGLKRIFGEKLFTGRFLHSCSVAYLPPSNLKVVKHEEIVDLYDFDNKQLYIFKFVEDLSKYYIYHAVLQLEMLKHIISMPHKPTVRIINISSYAPHVLTYEIALPSDFDNSSNLELKFEKIKQNLK